MKKTIIVITTLLILTVSAAALSSTFTDMGEIPLIGDIFDEKEVDFEKSNTADILRGYGYYADEINTIIEKLSEGIAMGGMSEKEIYLLFSLADEGYDFEKLIDIYNFLRLTDRDISYVKQIYDEADGFDNTFWIENAYERLTVSEDDMLALEDIYQYTDDGLSLDDIIMAYEMSLKGNIKIKEALNTRLEGNSWQEIAVAGYNLDKEAVSVLPDDLRDIIRLVTIADATDENVCNLLDEEKNLKPEIFEKYREKTLEKEQICLDMGKISDETVLSEAIELVPDITIDEAQKLIAEGYRIREIKDSLEGCKETDRTLAIKSAIYEYRSSGGAEYAE